MYIHYCSTFPKTTFTSIRFQSIIIPFISKVLHSLLMSAMCMCMNNSCSNFMISTKRALKGGCLSNQLYELEQGQSL